MIPIHDPENRIELQKSPQHVAFVPVTSLLDPWLRIFEGIEDVMEMDEHTRAQVGQDLEEQGVYVAAYF